MSRTKTPLTTSMKHCQISKSSPCTFYRNNIAINPVNISIHYHQLLNYAPHLQTTFISKLNKGKTNYGIGVITYTIVNNLHTHTHKKKKKKTSSRPKFQLPYQQRIYFKIDKRSSKLFAKQRKKLYVSTCETTTKIQLLSNPEKTFKIIIIIIKTLYKVVYILLIDNNMRTKESPSSLRHFIKHVQVSLKEGK